MIIPIEGICPLKELRERLLKSSDIKINKLFVDRKEILSVLGGKPGKYHGFKDDKLIGGTYKSTDSKFWEERGVLDKKIVGGVRLPPKDFQSKRKIDVPAS